MSRFLLLALIGVTSIPFVAPSSYASVLVSNLIGGVQNELEDDDFELLVNSGGTVLDPGGDTMLDVGDFVAGIFRITSHRQPPGGPQVQTAGDTENTVTAVFLTKITAVTIPVGGGLPDGNNDVNLMFGPATVAEWTAVFAGTAAPIPTAVAGTMAILFQDPDNIDQTLLIGPAFGTVDGTELWEVGFLGLAGELWSSNVDTADLLTQFATTTGSFSANVNVTEQGAGPELVPQALVLPAGAFADILLRNGSVGSMAPGSSFPVSSDVDLLLTPVIPEPISALVWTGLLFSAIGLVGRRR